MANPLKAFFDIRPKELPRALLMFTYFLLVITTFWVLKPIKKGLFISFYDRSGFDFGSISVDAAQAELLAKVMNMLVAYLATIVFSALSDRYRRQQLTSIFGGFFMLCFVGYNLLLRSPGDLTVWSFYLFGDLFSTLMVATFFVFLNDIMTPDSAKRTYGLIGLGGVTGGFLGSVVVRGWIDELAIENWLWICLGLTLLIVTIAILVGRSYEREHPELESSAERPPDTKGAPKPKTAGGNPAIEGAKLVFRSKYLLSIVGIVGIYEMVSTIMDFQFTSTVAHYLNGPDIGKQFGTAFAIMNGTAFFVQIFLTSYIMKNHGIKVALMALPLTTFLGSAGFMALPILWVGSLIPASDGGFSYSINQSAKESLYVPTTREEKYKAKAFIDMFVQRAAKALAVFLSLGITAWVTDFSGVRWLSLITVTLIAVWLLCARYAGKQFDRAAEKSGS